MTCSHHRQLIRRSDRRRKTSSRAMRNRLTPCCQTPVALLAEYALRVVFGDTHSVRQASSAAACAMQRPARTTLQCVAKVTGDSLAAVTPALRSARRAGRCCIPSPASPAAAAPPNTPGPAHASGAVSGAQASITRLTSEQDATMPGKECGVTASRGRYLRETSACMWQGPSLTIARRMHVCSAWV